MKICPNCSSIFEYENDEFCPNCKVKAKDFSKVTVLRVLYYKSGKEKTYLFDIPCKWEFDKPLITFNDKNKSVILNTDECSIHQETQSN